MRIIIAALICVAFIGGLSFYMNSRADSAAAPTVAYRAEAAEKSYALEITPTFAVEPDPFALQTEGGDLPPALLVRLGEKEILRETETLAAGLPIRVDPLEGLVVGINEIWFTASPPLTASGQSQAIRLRVFEENQAIASQTFWSEPGGTVAGTLRFTIEEEAEKEGGHDH